MNTIKSTNRNEEYDEPSFHDFPFEVINKSSDLLNYDDCGNRLVMSKVRIYYRFILHPHIELSNDEISENGRVSQNSFDEDFANEQTISIASPFSKSFKIRAENRISSFVDHTFYLPENSIKL
jgi:hypothetical protein